MSADGREMDSSGRISASVFTPLPPLSTGVASYSLRLILLSRDKIDWKVFYPAGSDPSILPPDVFSTRIGDASPEDIRGTRVFMLGNSPECFEVALALLRFGGCGVFHETVMHHMLRFCCLRDGRLDLYRRLLGFEYGPSAEKIERLLSGKHNELQYDALLKSHALVGALLHATDRLACLNNAAAAVLGARVPGRPIHIVGHPLDPLPKFAENSSTGKGMIVGMVGGGHPGRNLGVFLEALDRVRASRSGIGAALVGGGWPSDLPGWVASTGRLCEEDYQGWIRRLSVVVDIRHPTCNETSGSLLEAMRAGIPCVTTASGSSNYFPPDAALRIPAPPSASALARAIELVLADPGLASSLSTGARAHSAHESSIERARSDWLNILSGKPRRPVFAAPVQSSFSPALHDPPSGFSMAASPAGGPMTWSFDGTLLLDPPGSGDTCLLTVRGAGRANSVPLPREPGILELRGRVVLEGRGHVSQITWSR